MFDDYDYDGDKMDIRFELNSVDGRLTKSFSVDDTETWCRVVLEFTDFLAAQYGYCVSDRVLFVTDYAIGRAAEHVITNNEFEQILSQRKRDKALESLFDDEDEQ